MSIQMETDIENRDGNFFFYRSRDENSNETQQKIKIGQETQMKIQIRMFPLMFKQKKTE